MLNPENIHCLAENYVGVGDEKKEKPLYFVKSRLAFSQCPDEVMYPVDSSILWTEVELGIVVRDNCSAISENMAWDYIDGFVVCADITCSNLYGRDHHLGFSKSRKGFCPMTSDVIALRIEQLMDLKMETEINGKVTQRGAVSQMRYDPVKSLSYVSSIVPLAKGDVILTGTPAGHENNILQRGDRVRQTIDFLGELNYEII